MKTKIIAVVCAFIVSSYILGFYIIPEFVDVSSINVFEQSFIGFIWSWVLLLVVHPFYMTIKLMWAYYKKENN